jgi:5-formyltetrahydrofolate cyclo-ligase
MRAQLRAVPEPSRVAWSERACAAVAAAPWFATARCVFAFASLPDEVDSTPLLRSILARGKQLVLPRVQQSHGTLELIAVPDLADLQPGAFGVREPRAGTPVALSAVDIALVPGLAFDPHGSRLGRGAGFYDRCLAARPDLLACGLAFALQVVPRVPTYATDRAVQWLATDAGLTQCE